MLGDKCFWGDEIQSASFAQNNAVTILRYISQTEFSPPLNYLLLHLTSFFNKSEFILRLPLAISGIITIFLIYKFSSMLFSKKEGLISAFLLSISPFHIIYSRDARMYALFTMFSLMSFMFLYLSLKKNKWSLWVLYSLSIAFSLYTHYFTAFVIISQIIIFFIFTSEGTQFYGRFLFKYLFSLIFSFALFLPWVPSLLKQMSINQEFITPVPLVEVLLWVLDETFRWLGTGTVLGMFFFLIIVSAGIFPSIKTYRLQSFMALTAFFLPIPFSIFLIIWRNWLFQPRYLLFILPFYLILAARGICEIGKWFSKIGIRESLSNILLLLIILYFSTFQIKNIFTLEKENWRDVASYLSKNMKPQDILIAQPAWGFWAIDYYRTLTTIKTEHGDKNNDTGVWFVKPYDGKPGKDLRKMAENSFNLEKKFKGWNTINIWFSQSKLKKLTMPSFPLNPVKKINKKDDGSLFHEWVWSASYGEPPVFYQKEGLFFLKSNSILKDFILFSPAISLTKQDMNNSMGLYFAGRIRTSSHKISPEIYLQFFNQASENIFTASLKPKGLMTGDFTHWGWISEEVNPPKKTLFIRFVFKVPEIPKKGEWVQSDSLKFYSFTSVSENQAL